MARVQAEVASAGTRGAGPVIVAWKRCFCVGDQPGKGHRTVACREAWLRVRLVQPAARPRVGTSRLTVRQPM